MDIRSSWYRGIRMFSKVTELEYMAMLDYVKENRDAKIVYTCGISTKSGDEIYRMFNSIEEVVHFFERNPKIKPMMTTKAYLVKSVLATTPDVAPVTTNLNSPQYQPDFRRDVTANTNL